MKWYLIKLDINGNPYERSQAFNEEPVLEDGWDVVWNQIQWDNHLSSIVSTNYMTKGDIQNAAAIYQDLYFDNRAISFCLNIKSSLIAQGVTTATSLPYQMIEACARWVNKVWTKAYLYEAIQVESVDYVNDVGLPPCFFRDILWVVDSEFQVLEPNRIVNLDIDYYINWN